MLKNYEINTGDYCVDIFVREDGSFGFEEFRRDVEDMGRWTGLRYYSALRFNNETDALKEARVQIKWLSEMDV